jgi:hypothetical protein
MSGTVRWPRLTVLGNGVPLAGAEAAEVVANNHFAADRFAVSLALAADPAGLGALADADAIEVEVLVSLDDGAGFASLIRGDADVVALDPLAGTLRLEGRDFSARLIEARTREEFVNRTASEIATDLAGRHGLDADVQATSTPVGRYWNGNRARLTLDRFARATTEWDLLAALAGFEGFDLWVEGTTLHFRPGPDLPRAVLTPSAACGVRLERALTLAGDIEVTVKSWLPAGKAACVETAARPGRGGRGRSYVYVVPGLTAEQAARMAERKLAEVTRHERVVAIDMPGELDLSARQGLTLAGTGTGFDQDYWIDRIERRVSGAHGFRQTVHARNGDAGREAAAWIGS